MQISTLNSAGRPRHKLSHMTGLRPNKRQSLSTSPLSRAELRRIVAEMIG
jgi:hypothetical protein